MSDKSLPDASFISLGSTYHGIFRLPHGRWRTLIGKGGKPLVFTDAVSATRAAMAKMNSLLFPVIRAELPATAADPLQERWLAEAAAMKAQKADDNLKLRQHVERTFQHKAGRPTVEVVRIGRRCA